MKKLYYILFIFISVICLPLVTVTCFSPARGYNAGPVAAKAKSPVEVSVKETVVKDASATSNEIFINVRMKDTSKTQKMNIEEYLIGVVAAEMPVDFNTEALKAQAVAARTYAMVRALHFIKPKTDIHADADICTDSTHCQAWITDKRMIEKWGEKYTNNLNKIIKAVKDTKGIVICYKNAMINPLFHANSGGMTENPEDVWNGAPVPYLKSVVSYGEELNKEYKTVVDIPVSQFVSTIKKKYPSFVQQKKNIADDITVNAFSQSGRTKLIKVGNTLIKGTDMRSLFSLHSTNFKLQIINNTVHFTVIGFGHGVGMSQCGADYLADSGVVYSEILKYYYTGTEVLPYKNLNI